MDTVQNLQDIQSFLYQDILERLVDGAGVEDWQRIVMPEISYLEEQANQIRQARMQNSINTEAQPQDVASLNTQPQERAEWIKNNKLASFGADTIGAAGIGMANMANEATLGTIGLLASLGGRGVEAISPFSGEDREASRRLERLRALGATSRYVPNTRVYNDSWLTTLGKGAFATKNAIDDYLIDPARTYLLGENPNMLAQVAEGYGSILGFLVPDIF